MLRRRAARLAALETPSTAPLDGAVDDITVIGASIDPATAGAVAQLFASGEAEAVDLVPGDLPPDRALTMEIEMKILLAIDPRAYSAEMVSEIGRRRWPSRS